jgi:hypothetical protein
LSEALQEGTAIDAIVTSTLRKVRNEWILDEFDDSSFFVVTRKDDTELMRQVNAAIAMLDLESPEWREELREAYYAPENGDQISFLAEEREFLNSLSADGHVFSVAVSPDRKPYSYLDEKGNPTGVFIDAFKRLMDSLSLSYRFIPVSNRKEYSVVVNSKIADIWLDAYNNYSYAEENG